VRCQRVEDRNERNELATTPQLHMQWSIAASTFGAGVAGSF
jgi:hypothetical protein